MKKRILHVNVLSLVVLLLMLVGVEAQQAPPAEPESPAIPEGGNPEYRIKALPNDTFKPSEKISEDFPVPFPVDI